MKYCYCCGTVFTWLWWVREAGEVWKLCCSVSGESVLLTSRILTLIDILFKLGSTLPQDTPLPAASCCIVVVLNTKYLRLTSINEMMLHDLILLNTTYKKSASYSLPVKKPSFSIFLIFFNFWTKRTVFLC